MKTKAIVAIIVTVLLVSMAFYVLPVGAQNYLRIGVIGPFGRPQMTGMAEGAIIAKEWIDGPGGGVVIDGIRYDVQLHFGNEYSYPIIDVAAAALEMERLITVDQVDFVIGGSRTECVMAMREVAMNHEEIYFIAGADTNNLVDCGTGTCGACVRCDYDTYKYVFRNTPVNSTMLFYNLLGFLAGYVLPYRLAPLYGSPVNTAVIAEDLAWTVDKYNAFVYGGALGPQANIVYSARIPYPTTDFTPHLNAMHAAEVRLVVHLYSGVGSMYLVSQMAAYGYPKAVLCGIDVVGQTTEMWDATGGAVQYETFLAASGTRTPISTVSSPYTTEQFWDLYYAHSPVWVADLGTTVFSTPHAPIYTAWGVYDAIIALHDMLEAGTIHPPFNQNAGGRADALIPILEATDRNGILGRFKYTNYHDPYSIEYGPTWPYGYVRPFVVQWQAGRLEVVWPSQVAYSKIWVLPDEEGSMYPYPTDVNQDGEVNMDDASIVAGAFGSYPAPPDEVPDPTWQFAADIVRDNIINMYDVGRLRLDYLWWVDLPLPYCSEGGRLKPPIRDVAVVSVTPSATKAYAGQTVNISVVVRNEGTVNETFSVTLYYDSTAIGTQTVTDLAPGANTTVTSSWNTTGVAPCSSYTIRAEASVVPGETDIADNVYIDGAVKVKLLGDLNGDRIVDMIDMVLLRVAYGSTPIDPNWNPEADLYRDGVINIIDALILRGHYWETC